MEEQGEEFVQSLIKGRAYAIEANPGYEWYKFVDYLFGIHTFGTSGPGEAVYKLYGFEAGRIAEIIEELERSSR
jgi:transketolase